jgi:hypothetical protein
VAAQPHPRGRGGQRSVVRVYEAPNEEAIHAHSKLLGSQVIDEIYEVAGDVTPEDFPLTEEPV